VSVRQLEFDGKKVEAYATFRDDTDSLIAPCGKDYGVVQFDVGVDGIDALIQTSDGKYDTAGILGNGERAFISAKIPLDFKIGDDTHKTYAAFLNSYNSTYKAQWKLLDTRVVCDNTNAVALSEKGAKAAFRHSKNVNAHIQSAINLWTDAQGKVQTLSEKLNSLAKRKMNKESLVSILDKLFPKSETAKVETRRENLLVSILDRYEFNDNNTFPEQRGTAYNLLNAITGYVDHEKTVRITEGRKGRDESLIRTENAVFGRDAEFKSQVLETIYLDTQGNEIIVPSVYSVSNVKNDSGGNSGLLDDILSATIIGG
jgi:phage/plasmid-like protein (TIGR03299 family)